MKKNLFFLATAALALTACTSEEVVEVGRQGNAIGFEQVVGKQTRADETGVVGDLTTDNLKHFCVFGYYTLPNENTVAHSVFNNILVTKNNSSWGYDDIRYWVPKATYYFYAYSCGDIKLGSGYGSFTWDVTGSTTDDRVLKISEYLCDNTHQHDLIFASSTGITGKEKSEGNTPANANVVFQFKHILSKIDACFESKLPNEYTIEVTNVRVSNICNRADYNPVLPKGWSNHKRVAAKEGENTYVTLLSGNTIVAQNATAAADKKIPLTNSAFVIPREYESANVTISFDIKIKNGNDLVLTRHMSGSWQPTWTTGYKYTYKIVIDGNLANLEAIVFETEASLNDWTPGSDDTTMSFSAN